MICGHNKCCMSVHLANVERNRYKMLNIIVFMPETSGKSINSINSKTDSKMDGSGYNTINISKSTNSPLS